MTPALHSWSFRERFSSDAKFDVFSFIDAAAGMGFGAVEIMAGKAGAPLDHAGPDDASHLRRVVQYAAERGVRVECFSTYNDFAFVKNEEWRLANIAYVQQWTRLAADAGVPQLRLLTGYRVPEVPVTQLEALVRDGIRQCVLVAEKARVQLALENHSSVILDPAAIAALLDEIGSPFLTACIDPTNWTPTFFKPGTSAADRAPALKGAALLAPRASHAHLKVAGVEPDGSLTGWGGDLVELLRIYRRAGYSGAIALESIASGDLTGPLEPARRALQEAWSAAA